MTSLENAMLLLLSLRVQYPAVPIECALCQFCSLVGFDASSPRPSDGCPILQVAHIASWLGR